MPPVSSTVQSGAPAQPGTVATGANATRQKPGLKSAMVLGVATIAAAAVGAGLVVMAPPVAPLILALAVGLGIATMIAAGNHFCAQNSASGTPMPEDELNRRTEQNFVPSNLQYPGVEPYDAPDFDPN